MDKRIARCNHLMRRAQKGSEKAFDLLFEEFGSLFLAIAKKYLYDKDYAPDLVSEVFVDLVRTSAKSFDENKNGLNWMYTIIRHKAYRHNQKTWGVYYIDDLDASHNIGNYFYDSGKGEEEAVEHMMLKQGMAKLTAVENTILYYKYWEGMTVRQIAEKLGATKSTIQYKIDTILKKLKEYCREEE